jgi:hypothetical protein
MAVLDGDIRRLKAKAKELESQIDDQFAFFQQHSGSLFVRSLLPRKIEGEELTGYTLVDKVLQNERLQTVLLKLADILAEKLGDSLNWLVTRVFKK